MKKRRAALVRDRAWNGHWSEAHDMPKIICAVGADW